VRICRPASDLWSPSHLWNSHSANCLARMVMRALPRAKRSYDPSQTRCHAAAPVGAAVRGSPRVTAARLRQGGNFAGVGGWGCLHSWPKAGQQARCQTVFVSLVALANRQCSLNGGAITSRRHHQSAAPPGDALGVRQRGVAVGATELAGPPFLCLWIFPRPMIRPWSGGPAWPIPTRQ
jgi:hypothetical protein